MTFNSVRTSVFGRLVYKYSNYKYFTYPEEQPDYEIPKKYIAVNHERIILEWEDGDPTHPKNWSWAAKMNVYIQMTFLTFVAYLGGPISSPAAPEIMKEFNIGYVVSTLPLCLYIMGYGTTQMYFSPISEQPNIGRTPVYATIAPLLAIFQIPCALSKNMATLCVFRFISGLCAAPSQSVGAASYADITKTPYIPTALVIWGLAAFCGPSMGPIVAVGLMKSSWRNIYWFLFALNMAIAVWIFVASPETNDQTLLVWKAQRLRRVTGNPNIIAKCELEEVNTGKLLATISKRAIDIIVTQPIVLFMDVYQGLTYGCLYLWFEAFPIAFHETYHFVAGAEAATYNSINVGVVLGGALYIWILYHTFSKHIIKGEQPNVYAFLNTSVLGCAIITVSVFVFGWTVSPKIHWFPSLIGATLFGAGCLIVLQSNLNYLGMLYPRFVASVFGGNGLFRSFIGGTIPLYGRAMFKNTGSETFPVGWGCSILGFIFLIFTFFPLLFKKYDKRWTRESKYAGF